MTFIVKKILPNYNYWWKPIVPVVRNITQTKIQVLEKLNKIH